jgi:hypothetical protein
MKDVSAFMHCLVEESVNAHPDTDFTDYINLSTGEPTYTPEEAAMRNALMSDAFNVCEKTNTDIYSFMQEIFLTETGLDKLIPLPSSVSKFL